MSAAAADATRWNVTSLAPYADSWTDPALEALMEAAHLNRVDRTECCERERADVLSRSRGEPPVSTILPGAKSYPTRPRRR
jgi:hypothetical protein